MRVVVLGAGIMGGAMAEIAAQRGHDVRLWGTWMDDGILDPVFAGREHPRLTMVLDRRVTPFRSADLARALEGAELVVYAVKAEAAVAVMTKAAPHLPKVPIVSVTKGMLPGASGKMETIDHVLEVVADRPLRFVYAAGPAKATELVRDVLTWMHFCGSLDDARACAEAFAGGNLRLTVSSDLVGAQICAAMKCAYASIYGFFDGTIGPECHNARAACFTQAIAEMAKLVVAGGGLAETVYGPSGVGDLHVTATVGQHRNLAERVGRGEPPRKTADAMLAAGVLHEDTIALVEAAWRFASERGVKDLPLLGVLHEILCQEAPVVPALARLRTLA